MDSTGLYVERDSDTKRGTWVDLHQAVVMMKARGLADCVSEAC